MQAEHHFDWLMGAVLPYANFFIFLALAVIFLRKPALAAAQKRRDDYRALAADAAKAKLEAEARLRELTEKQANLDREMAEIKAISKQSAEADAAKIVADAERLAAHLKEEARRIAEAEVQAARAELRREIVAQVREQVESRIAQDLDASSQLKLVRKQMGELGSLKAEG